MSWPALSGVNPGFAISPGGVTTIRWGTDYFANWTNGTGKLFAQVLRAKQRTMGNNYKYTNADGMTSSRTMIIEGSSWDLTIRDDSDFTSLPRGSTISVIDGAGMIHGYDGGGRGLAYVATVTESDYEATGKQPGERVLTVENLILIENQTGS